MTKDKKKIKLATQSPFKQHQTSPPESNSKINHKDVEELDRITMDVIESTIIHGNQ